MQAENSGAEDCSQRVISQGLLLERLGRYRV